MTGATTSCAVSLGIFLFLVLAFVVAPPLFAAAACRLWRAASNALLPNPPPGLLLVLGAVSFFAFICAKRSFGGGGSGMLRNL